MLNRIIVLSILVVGIAFNASAQDIGDGVRLGSGSTETNPRAMGMGGAMVASVNDYSALHYNPAAISILSHGEFALSLFYKSHSSTADFLGATTTDDISQTIPYSFGYAVPMETERGHLAFGISLDRVADFTSTYTFKAINGSSSFLNTRDFIQDPGYKGGDFGDYKARLDRENLAWATYLTEDIDTNNTALTSRFKNGLQQAGTLTQEGGLNAFRIGGGVDVAENIAIGGTINYYFGSYDYHRTFTESDVNNIFDPANSSTAPPDGFESATIIDNRSQSIQGISLKFGMYAAPDEHLSVGLTFETPIVYDIEDNFTRSAISRFNNGITYDSRTLFPNPEITYINDYTVISPLKLAAGLAYTNWGLTVTASGEFVDHSQLRFDNEDVDLSDLDDDARDELKGVLNWNIGAEYLIAPIGVLVRGGYSVQPSAYQGDGSEFDVKSFSGGVGFLLSKAALLELSYRNSSYQLTHQLYKSYTPEGQAVSAIIDKDVITASQFSLGFSFRF